MHCGGGGFASGLAQEPPLYPGHYPPFLHTVAQDSVRRTKEGWKKAAVGPWPGEGVWRGLRLFVAAASAQAPRPLQ